MSKRKFSFKELTDAQLTEIAAEYPNAVETTVRPNYRVLAMMAECGAKLSTGKTILDLLEV